MGRGYLFLPRDLQEGGSYWRLWLEHPKMNSTLAGH